jgi:sarcosine oxidase
VQRAHELWRELEATSGKSLMTITGGLMIGPPDGSVVSGTLRSARDHGLPHEILTASAVHDRFPAFELAADLVTVMDPRAGYLDPEACNRAHIDAARNAGAQARFDEPLIEWNPDGIGVRVRTQSRSYTADQLVLAGGAWTSSLAPDLGLPLAVERQTVFWFESDRLSGAYGAPDFPIYAYEYKPGHICYGFPRLPRGMKASVMHSGELARDAESVRRAVTDDEARPLRAALRPVLPELAEAKVRESSVCIFTNTPDHDFIIDFHPEHRQVLISSPCSGHGFKFASAIGELQADLITGDKARFDISPFRATRWSK